MSRDEVRRAFLLLGKLDRMLRAYNVKFDSSRPDTAKFEYAQRKVEREFGMTYDEAEAIVKAAREEENERHQQRLPHPNPPGRRDPTDLERREYLHTQVDELLYPVNIRQRNVDVGALQRIAHDVTADDELRAVLDDAETVDEMAPYVIPTLMRVMHDQISNASVWQIEHYAGPFLRIPTRNPLRDAFPDDFERLRRQFPGKYRWWRCPKCFVHGGLKSADVDASKLMCPDCHVNLVPEDTILDEARRPHRNPRGNSEAAAAAAYERFHDHPPTHVDVKQRWYPGELVIIGAGVDIGYDVHDRGSSKEGPYVHDFGPMVTIYRRWHPKDGEPDVVLRDWPTTLWLLAPNLGFTYKDADQKTHEIKGSKNKRLMATPDGRRLAVVGPSGVEFAAWGGNMRVTDWIHD